VSNYNDAITRAIDHVIAAFGEKMRSGPVPVPAYTHSLRVGLALIQYECDLVVILAGFLHDTLEDTKMSSTNIQRLFNARVRYLVEQCSYDPKLGDTREGSDGIVERVIRLASQGEVAPLIIECADYNDNLQTNKNLKEVYQHGQYERGSKLCDAGTVYIPDHRVVYDLHNTLLWEKRRLGL
jgi:(p)ppGpp synthase/HD superfamily hydrolase